MTNVSLATESNVSLDIESSVICEDKKTSANKSSGTSICNSSIVDRGSIKNTVFNLNSQSPEVSHSSEGSSGGKQ